MRVLIVTSIFPPDIGGPATYVPMIARALHDRGHGVTVVTGSDRDDLGSADGLPFSVVRLNRQRSRLIRKLEAFKRIYKLARGVDVVFGNSSSMLEAAVAARLRGKPYVLKVVGDSAWESAMRWGWTTASFDQLQQTRSSFRTELLKAARSWHARRAHLVIVPSRFLGGVVRRWGVPRERIEVIGNAFDAGGIHETAVLPLPTPVNLVSIGRLVSWKRVEGIIRALESLAGVGLVVVGEGPEERRLKLLSADLGMGDRVYFAGRLSKEESAALARACDVFVLNSTYEGLPHVLAEAMTWGLPIVATAVGGTPETILNERNGLLISPDDPDALPKALRRMTTDAELRGRLSSQARSDAAELFDPTLMAERTEAALLKAAASRG